MAVLSWRTVKFPIYSFPITIYIFPIHLYLLFYSANNSRTRIRNFFHNLAYSRGFAIMVNRSRAPLKPHIHRGNKTLRVVWRKVIDWPSIMTREVRLKKNRWKSDEKKTILALALIDARLYRELHSQFDNVCY